MFQLGGKIAWEWRQFTGDWPTEISRFTKIKWRSRYTQDQLISDQTVRQWNYVYLYMIWVYKRILKYSQTCKIIPWYRISTGGARFILWEFDEPKWTLLFSYRPPPHLDFLVQSPYNSSCSCGHQDFGTMVRACYTSLQRGVADMMPGPSRRLASSPTQFS